MDVAPEAQASSEKHELSPAPTRGKGIAGKTRDEIEKHFGSHSLSRATNKLNIYFRIEIESARREMRRLQHQPRSQPALGVALFMKNVSDRLSAARE